MNKVLLEICGNCGCTYESHHAGINPWPFNYCPGHEGRMDWEKGPGTTFEPTGIYKEDKEEGDDTNSSLQRNKAIMDYDGKDFSRREKSS